MDMLYTVTIEVPKWSFTKYSEDGTVDFISPLPCPFNYGSVAGHESEDGDQLDALLLGRRRNRGEQVLARLVTVVIFTDEGLCDDKLVLCPQDLDLAHQLVQVERFFQVYARCKSVLNRVRGGNRPTRFEGFSDEARRVSSST